MKKSTVTKNLKNMNFDDLCIVITKHLKDKCRDALKKDLIPLDSSGKPLSVGDFTEIESNTVGEYVSIRFNVWLKPYEIPYIKVKTKAYYNCLYNINIKCKLQ